MADTPGKADSVTTDDWPLSIYGSAQDPEYGNLQCGVCYDTFWSGDQTNLAELRAAIGEHIRVCKGAP